MFCSQCGSELLHDDECPVCDEQLIETECESCGCMDMCTDWSGRNLCDDCGDASCHDY